MFRVLMPKGRLLETQEIIAISSDDSSEIRTVNYHKANGIAFKDMSGDCWAVYGVDRNGIFRSVGSAVWDDIVEHGYIDFTLWGYVKYNTECIRVRKLTDDAYNKLKSSMNDII